MIWHFLRTGAVARISAKYALKLKVLNSTEFSKLSSLRVLQTPHSAILFTSSSELVVYDYEKPLSERFRIWRLDACLLMISVSITTAPYLSVLEFLNHQDLLLLRLRSCIVQMVELRMASIIVSPSLSILSLVPLNPLKSRCVSGGLFWIISRTRPAKLMCVSNVSDLISVS